ncbi:Glutathione S-transferase [Ancistrocladus abbreviatus]
MGKGDVKVLGTWVSPFALRARIALNLKSVDYEFVAENLGNKSELLLKSNPVHKKVPVLIHQHKPVCESLIIVQYVDETWTSAPSVLASDPYERATARFWAAFVDDKFWPSMRGIGLAKGEDAERKIREMTEELAILEDAFLKCNGGKHPFFGGDSLNLVDIALGSLLGWLRVGEMTHNVKLIDASTTPLLAGWADRFIAHPAVKEIMPEPQKLYDFLQAAVAGAKK